MVDQKTGVEHNAPAQEGNGSKYGAGGRVVDLPEDLRHRTPLPVEQEQDETGDENERTAFDGLGDEARPPSLEAGAGHDAVLDGKKAKQREIDGERGGEGTRSSGVDGFGDKEVFDESERVQERDQEGQIRHYAIDEKQDAFHMELPLRGEDTLFWEAVNREGDWAAWRGHSIMRGEESRKEGRERGA